MTASATLPIAGESVRPEWIDYNGHMNVAYFVLAFDHALDQFLDQLDIGDDYRRRTGHSTYILETHVHYVREVHEGAPLAFRLQLLDFDARRLHYMLEMRHADADYIAATSEQLLLHVDQSGPRAAPFPPHAYERVAALHEMHRTLPWPERAGTVIGIRRRMAASHG
ncbi:thioesterase family protein [Oceanibacterium hippocampi]|uniref:L-carnitine dehydrogenase n=1 Tax=Oceanibacterium hippocampi TaxID=745714 RepID=A0A1Y5TR94_9PROT|nr:thioesterase family protein [Oceanibacterium hippocampi]SLN70269.1 L-carnitine dehydrogenase [Oceanibacterium hippocampi]